MKKRFFLFLFRNVLHTLTRLLHTLTQTHNQVAPSIKITRIPLHHRLTAGTEKAEIPYLCHCQVWQNKNTFDPNLKRKTHASPKYQPIHTETNFPVTWTQKKVVTWLLIYASFPFCRKEEGAPVPVPVWDATDALHEELHLVGPVLLWNLSVFLPKQGKPSTALGSKKRKPQDHDLPEDGTSTEELLPHRRNSQSEKEAHLSIRWEDTERSTRKF